MIHGISCSHTLTAASSCASLPCCFSLSSPWPLPPQRRNRSSKTEANEDAFWIDSKGSNRATPLLPSRIRLGLLSLQHRAVTISVKGTTQEMQSRQLQVSMVTPSQSYRRRIDDNPISLQSEVVPCIRVCPVRFLPADPAYSTHPPDPTTLFRSARSSSVPDLMVSAVGLGEIAIHRINE